MSDKLEITQDHFDQAKAFIETFADDLEVYTKGTFKENGITNTDDKAMTAALLSGIAFYIAVEQNARGLLNLDTIPSNSDEVGGIIPTGGG